MEIRLLRYFMAVAREGNITRAAESLHITQPSLSKQLMELETEMGKQLLIRGKRGVKLTDEGMLLRKRADEILSLCSKTKQEISQSEKQIRGEISLAGTASTVVSKSIAALLKKYPNIRIKFQNGDAEKIEDDLNHGLLDFGILLEPIDIMKYEHISLNENAQWGFLMHKSCKLAQRIAVTPKDIEDISLILPRRTGLQRLLSVWAGCETENMKVAATFDVFLNNPLTLIEENVGCGFVLSSMANTDEHSSLCFRPLNPPLTVQYGLVWKRYSAFSKAEEKFISEVKNQLNIV